MKTPRAFTSIRIFQGKEIVTAETSKLALSIRQPWAWLVVNGFKDIENRTWQTKVRGPILIHAAKGMTRQEYEDCQYFMYLKYLDTAYSALPDFNELPRGGIVGSAVIKDCVTRSDSPWFTGPYGLILDQTSAFKRILKINGALKFFCVPWPPPISKGDL